MIDKLNRTQSTNSVTSQAKKRTDKPKSAQQPQVDVSLLDELIGEIKAEKTTLSPDTLQHKLIVKTLINHFGFGASTEPKFNQMYEHINEGINQNKQAQALIVDAIKRYGR